MSNIFQAFEAMTRCSPSHSVQTDSTFLKVKHLTFIFLIRVSKFLKLEASPKDLPFLALGSRLERNFQQNRNKRKEKCSFQRVNRKNNKTSCKTKMKSSSVSIIFWSFKCFVFASSQIDQNRRFSLDLWEKTLKANWNGIEIELHWLNYYLFALFEVELKLTVKQRQTPNSLIGLIEIDILQSRLMNVCNYIFLFATA
jgi:hypothetical protein